MTLTALKLKSDLHIARKLWHLIGVFVIIVGYNYFDRPTTIALLGSVSVAFILFDILRLYNPKINKVILTVMQLFMRESERDSLAGTTYLFSAACLIVYFCDYHVTNLALAFLAIGDPMASLMGVSFGKVKIIAGKSLVGFLTAFTCCLAISYFYFNHMGLYKQNILMISAVCGLAGALSELIPIGQLDDNFSLPILSATFLTGLFYFYPAVGF